MNESTHNYNDTARLLLDAYLKVLRVDLTHDSFDEIKVSDAEADDSHGYSDKISEWFAGFARTGHIHPNDLAEYNKFTDLDNLRRTFAAGRKSVSLRYRRRRFGAFRWARMTLRRSDGYTDENRILVLFIEDIHDDVLAAQEMSDQRNITSALVAMYFTCLYVDMKTNTYRRVHVSEGFKEWIPESGSMYDVVKIYTERLVIPSDGGSFLDNFSIPAIQEKLHTQNSYDYEYWGKTEHGTIWCRICAIVADRNEDGSPRHIIVAMQDVTAQAESVAHTNAMLKEAFSAAVAANSAKSEFMSRMSHDIRTPLNGIIGMTAIAGAHLDDRERVADCLTKITGAGRHLLSLINDILDLSKIESGKVSLVEADFNLPALIDEMLGMVHSSIVEHHHELNVYVHNVTHEDVIGDNVRLQQVFMNLVSNAIKYTPDGGKISISLMEMPSGSANIGQYRFVCEDNGYGMSEEFQQKLFEPFERADDTRIGKIQGTGLGMTIARNIVGMMGGDIHVESRENCGSKFTVTFKIKLCSDPGKISEDLIDLPVLVVDDDEITCESTCLTLNELGMKGDYALCGADAIRKVEAAHGDGADYFACLVDWRMPGMDGFETTRRIREIVGPDVTIIIISAYDWEDIEEEAVRAGADAFICKPLFKSRLHAAFTDLPRSVHRAREEDGLEDFSRRDYSDRRLLLVEDNELNREIALELLQMTGARVDSAENGKIAVEMFERAEPGCYDLIFMDIRMPVMDGYEAARRIRALPRADAARVPIIALTADAFIGDIEKARQAGMNQHMAKPIEPPRLLALMEEFLGDAPQESAAPCAGTPDAPAS